MPWKGMAGNTVGGSIPLLSSRKEYTMFSVEIRVNGAIISIIYGRNVELADDGDNIYDYEYYQPEIGSLLKGTVKHSRAEGLTKLVYTILDNIFYKEYGGVPHARLSRIYKKRYTKTGKKKSRCR